MCAWRVVCVRVTWSAYIKEIKNYRSIVFTPYLLEMCLFYWIIMGFEHTIPDHYHIALFGNMR